MKALRTALDRDLEALRTLQDGNSRPRHRLFDPAALEMSERDLPPEREGTGGPRRRAALVDLDWIMTRICAAEAKLALVKEGRQPSVG